MQIRRLVLMVPLLLVALMGSGCIFSPDNNDPNPPPPTPPPPFPGDPDTLMTNFRSAYSSMKIDDYRIVLNPQYVFILNPDDVPPGESDRLTYAEELHIAENMFSGEPLEKPNGDTVPGISSIAIAALNRLGPWTNVGPNDPDFPNTKRGLYEIQLSFSRADANTIIVSGQQEFYVTNRDSLVNGAVRQFHQLRGQRDLTQSK